MKRVSDQHHFIAVKTEAEVARPGAQIGARGWASPIHAVENELYEDDVWVMSSTSSASTSGLPTSGSPEELLRSQPGARCKRTQDARSRVRSFGVDTARGYQRPAMKWPYAQVAGPVNASASTRSRIPPWPGKMPPLSFTPLLRLSTDMSRSPA